MPRRAVLAAAAAAAFAPSVVGAATATWTGAVDNNWATDNAGATNWSGGSGTDGVPASGDSATFTSATGAGGTALYDNLTSGTFNIAGITFNTGAPGYVLNGNAFALTGALTNNSTSLQSINNAIALSATQTVNANTGTISLNGVISGTGFGLTKTGTGLLNLTAANTYTGTNTLSAGTVGIVADNNLGAGSTLTFDGGALRTTGGSITNSHAITIDGNGGTLNALGFSYILGNTLGGTGTLTLNGNGALGNFQNVVLNGTNSFAGGLVVQSGASVEYGSATALSASATVNVNSGGRFSASNVAMGTALTVADGGTLAFQNNNSGSFTNTVTLSGGTANVFMFDWYDTTNHNGAISGQITGNGGLNVFATSGATLTLSGSNNYTGATAVTNTGITVNGANGTIAGSSGYTLNNSTFTLDYTTGNNNKLNDSGAVSLAQNSFLAVTPNTSAATSETTGTLGIAGGNSTLTLTAATGQVTTLAAASLSRTNLATALVRGSALDQSAATAVSRLTLADGGASLAQVGTNQLSNGATSDSTQALKIVPYLLGDTNVAGNGSNFVTYDSTLGLRVLQATEQTTLAAGYTTAANPDNAIAFNGTLSTTSNVTLNSLLFKTVTQTLNGSGGTLTVNSGAVAAVANTEVIGNGFSGLVLGNGEGVITATSGNTLTVNAPVSVTAGGGLTKAGAGTLTLTASNSYTGQTTVNQGTLTASTTNNMFNGTAGTALQVNLGGTFGIGATTQTITSLGLVGSATVSGSGGTLNLGGDVTYDGSKNLAAATVSVSNLNLNGTRTVTTTSHSAAIAPVSGTNLATPDLVVSSVIADGSASSGLTKAGTGTLALTGSNSYSGTTTINGGTLQIGNNGTTGSLNPAGSIADFGTLAFARTDTITQGSQFSSAAITGTGGITQNSGTVVLNAANSFSGPINILNGTMSVSSIGNSGANGNLGTNGTINLGSVGVNNAGVTATLQYTGGGETTNRGIYLAGFDSASTTVLDSSGSGLLKITGNVTGNYGSKTLTLQGSGSGELAGTLADFGTGQLSVTKTGTGTWTLSGNNSFSGATTLSGGALQLTNANALAASPLTLNTGTTLQLRGDVNTTFSTNGITINSDPTSGSDTTSFTIDVNAATAASNKTLTLGGAITMLPTGGSRGSDSATINVTGASGYTLALGGGLTLPANGSGSTVTLAPASGLNLTVASVTQPGGSNPGTLVFSGAGNTGVTGALSRAGNRTLNVTFNQTGTATLNAAGVDGGGSNTWVSALNSGTTVFNNAGALHNVQINLGNQTASSTGAATFLLGGGTGGLGGGLTLTSTVKAFDTTSGLLSLGGQNTTGTNAFSGNVTLGATTNTGKDVNLVAASGGQVDFTGNLVKNGTATTGGLFINNPYTVNGAAVTPTGTVRLAGANTYVGATTLAGGVLLADSAAALNTSALGGNVTFTGGTLRYGSTFAAGANADISGRVKSSTGPISIDTNGQSVTYASAVDSSNTGGLTKLGANTLLLNASNGYTGGTTVSAGTLLVGDSSHGTAAIGAVAVNGGTLGGYGTVGALSVNSGGTVSPGGSVGTLNAGATSLAGTYLDEINSTTSDLLAVTGNLTLGGTLSVSDLTGGSGPYASSYVLATYTGTLSGTFASVMGAPNGYNVDTTSTPGQVLLDPTATPEPASLGLFGVAAAGLLLRRRRRAVPAA